MKRVLLKLSGEALAGEKKTGFDEATCIQVAKQVKELSDQGMEIGIVIGGGNFWRGRSSENIDRTKADQIGMLATVMNSLALAESLEQVGVEARVMTNVDMPRVAESYCYGRAMHHLEKGRVVVFAGGSGNPYFSTDSAAALKAAEMHADILLMAKNIDGVYTADPKTDPTAVRLDSMTYDRILEEHLNVIDSTAACLLRDNAVPTMIFALDPPENIVRVVCGERIGTIVR